MLSISPLCASSGLSPPRSCRLATRSRAVADRRSRCIAGIPRFSYERKRARCAASGPPPDRAEAFASDPTGSCRLLVTTAAAAISGHATSDGDWQIWVDREDLCSIALFDGAAATFAARSSPAPSQSSGVASSNLVGCSTDRSAGLALSVSCPPSRPQPRQIGEMRAVGHQAAGVDKALEGVRRPQSARGCKTDKPAMIAISLEKMGLPATRPLARARNSPYSQTRTEASVVTRRAAVEFALGGV